MASTNYSHGSTQASVSEVVRAVIRELRELRTRYREVNTRIRHLRITVDTLQQLDGNVSSVSSDTEQFTPAVEDHPTASDPFAAGFAFDPSSHTAPGRENPELRRACRIDDAVSDAEIYSRIVRRGSYSFPCADSAARAIAEELHAMLVLGELRRVGNLATQAWQRIEDSNQ
jgi:Arc/MetJ-type ribon-helix-helix transcriptional regulator